MLLWVKGEYDEATFTILQSGLQNTHQECLDMSIIYDKDHDTYLFESKKKNIKLNLNQRKEVKKAVEEIIDEYRKNGGSILFYAVADPIEYEVWIHDKIQFAAKYLEFDCTVIKIERS